MIVRYLGSARHGYLIASRRPASIPVPDALQEQARGIMLTAVAVAGASLVTVQGGPLGNLIATGRHPSVRSAGIDPVLRRIVPRSGEVTIALDEPMPLHRHAIVPPDAHVRPASSVRPQPASPRVVPPLSDDEADEIAPVTAPEISMDALAPPPLAAASTPPGPPEPASRYLQTARGIAFTVETRINGRALGRLELTIEGSDIEHPERVSADIAIRLGDIVALLRAGLGRDVLDLPMSPELLDRYVTFGELRTHGISASFDRADRLVLRT